MKLTYNGFELHSLGKVVVASETSEALPAEAPQEFKRRLAVRVLTHQPGYVENYALVKQGRAAVSVTQAQLKFTDDAGAVLIDQPVSVAGLNWPEQPNAYGTYHQLLEVVFEYREGLSAAQSLTRAATVQNAAGGTVLTLGGVEGVKTGLAVTRYASYLPNRRDVDGTIELRGTMRGDATKAVGVRQAALEGLVVQLRALLVAGKEVKLSYGGLWSSKVVRVEGFQAQVDQAVWAVPWSLSARYTDFPNESGFAQCELTVTTREEKESGRKVVVLSGQIASSSEARAKEKLAAVRGAVVGVGYKCQRSEVRSEQVRGEDGDGFVRLSFEEEWMPSSGDVVDWELRVNESDDVAAATGLRTYSGTVTASGADYDAALATAKTKAKELGYGKHQMLRRSVLEGADRARNAELPDGNGAKAQVSLSFLYEYQVKLSRIYYEVNTRVMADQFGQENEVVSGFVAGADRSAMEAVYASEIRALFTGRLVRSEETGRTEQAIQEWNYTTDQASGDGSARVKQDGRLEFSLVLGRARGTSSLRYEMAVAKDYLNNKLVTSVRGTVWASSGDVVEGTNDAATVYLEAFLASLTAGLSLGPKVQSVRTASGERAPALVNEAVTEIFAGLNFEEVWETKLSGSAAILESEVSEQWTPSGDRIVVQPTALTNVVLQACGKVEGVRQVSGRVKATTETAALSWIQKQRTIPVMTGVSGTGMKATPVQVSFVTRYNPQVDGAVLNQRPVEGNVQAVEGSFSFTEYYESLTSPA